MALNAVYFNNSDFTASTQTRVDSQVNFYWGGRSPSPGHNHVYERLSINGVPYIVNGAGADTDSFGSILGASIVRSNSDNGPC